MRVGKRSEKDNEERRGHMIWTYTESIHKKVKGNIFKPMSDCHHSQFFNSPSALLSSFESLCIVYQCVHTPDEYRILDLEDLDQMISHKAQLRFLQWEDSHVNPGVIRSCDAGEGLSMTIS